MLVQSFGRYLRYMRLGCRGGVRPCTRYVVLHGALYGILPCILRESNRGVGLSGRQGLVCVCAWVWMLVSRLPTNDPSGRVTRG